MGEIPHILSAAPFTPVNLEPIFSRSQELRELDQDKVQKREHALRYLGARTVNLFYQESTRTRISFGLAEAAWGVGKEGTENARVFSSTAKGEDLEHTIEVIGQYNPDFVVVRYDEEGGAARAAAVLDKPIINAGDGPGEHPTQAIADALTIWEQIGRLDNLRVSFMGDLKYGRTIRSLVHVLSKGKNNHFDFISHPDLRLSEDIKQLLSATPGATFREFFEPSALAEVLPGTDVFYVTRTQTNLGATKVESNDFRLTLELADLIPPHGIIMHPMPIDRSDPLQSEIAPDVDRHPRSRYYRQAGNGFYSRMALIERIMEGKPILAETA